MPKHVDGTTCPSCEAKLKSAHRDLDKWFREFVKPKFPSAHVSCAFRNKYEQNQAHAEGKSRAPWPKSKHNHIAQDGTPCALAIDLFELASNGMACWHMGYFRKIAQESEAAGYTIEWGGLWPSLADGPHFQMPSKVRNQLG